LSTLVVLAVAVASTQATGTYPATPLASKTGYILASNSTSVLIRIHVFTHILISESNNQDFCGVYALNSQVLTYTQPPEPLGPITTMPYTACMPASSNCI
ncbi:hypothetical protein AN958_06130, partial [Leucoagaricus sp. SymC.cos]